MSLPNGTFLVGNKLMAVCRDCQQVIRLDKPILGSLHICEAVPKQPEYSPSRMSNPSPPSPPTKESLRDLERRCNDLYSELMGSKYPALKRKVR